MSLWPLILLLFPLNALAETATERFCFNSAHRAQAVLARLQVMLVPSDQVDLSQSCLTINMAQHRRELIQSFIRNLDPQVNISFSSAEVKREPCRLKVEKTQLHKQADTAASLSLHAVKAQATQFREQIKETLQIQTIDKFELTVNEYSVQGSCRLITPQRYEISLEVRQDATPLHPPVAAGTIVIIPTDQLPASQRTFKLSTTLQLGQGERVELGSVIAELKGQQEQGQAQVQPQLGAQSTQGQRSEKVYLSLQ